jgi:hypothetical protein
MDAPGLVPRFDLTPAPVNPVSRMGTSPLLIDRTLYTGEILSADAVLFRFSGYLANIFPDWHTGVGRRRKTCFVTAGPINVDVTPVIHFVSTVGGIDEYWMPEGNGEPSWKRTNLKIDQRNVSRTNQALDGNLLKVIRMLKWWNATRNADRLKGIHLETMVIQLMAGRRFTGWSDTLRYLFDGLRAAVLQDCPDPTGLGPPLNSSLAVNDRAETATALAFASHVATRADQLAAQGETQQALLTWRYLFAL